MGIQYEEMYEGIKYRLYRDDDYPYFYYCIEPGTDSETDSSDGYDTIKGAAHACIAHIERLLDIACGCDVDYDISPGYEDHE